MSKSVTWLHVSDLHAGKPGANWDAPRVIDALVSDLRKMEHDHGLYPDLIFFTGDAAFGQDPARSEKTLPEQYEIAEQFLTRLRQAYSPEIPRLNMFLVPGNHDVNRQVVGQDQIEWLDKQTEPVVINGLIESVNRQWQHYMERLEDYTEFLRTNRYSHLLEDPSRLVFAAERQVSGITLGIAGFNTAWSSCRDGERGKLWAGCQWQLERARSLIPDDRLSISLMHHPTSWLTEYEEPDFGRGLERDFKFTLHGHEHADWVSPGPGGHTRIAAGACYQRSDKENGYNLVRLDLETGTGEVWLRRYEHTGGGWIPCIVHGKTDDRGMWPLSNLSWMTSIAAPPPVPEQPTEAQPAQGTPAPPTRASVVHVPLDLALSDIIRQEGLAEAIGFREIGVNPESLLVLFPQVPTALERTREDISWQVVESTMEPAPLEEKTPLLQELRTERQIADHFLPLGKFTDRLAEWLVADRDLLFLGLPFCGKTTLLTYLALEGSRTRRGEIIPIYLKPREGLLVEETKAAVVRLKDSLRQGGIFNQRQQVVLILDNVHTPTGFEIGRLLMESPRPWRLWAAARSREFAERVQATESLPWSSEDYVRNACDLIGEREIDFVVDGVIAPILVGRGEERHIEHVRREMKEAGQVPVRFLAQVWRLIRENRGDVDSGYSAMIKAEPTGVEEIVRHVMPQHRAGIDALTIADYLKRPSWELLEEILSTAEAYGREVARTTIAGLRETLALLPDSEQPCRVTMYDPVRDRVKAPGNLTDSLRKQIWSAVDSFLEQAGGRKEEGEPSHLADAWIALSQLAMSDEKHATALRCAERANMLAEGAQRVETLRLVAKCLHEPEPDCAGIVACLREITGLIPLERAAERAKALGDLAYCLCCQHVKPEPMWDEAIAVYRQALEVLTQPEHVGARARALYQLAHGLCSKPQPRWDEAIALYRQALELLSRPDDVEARAEALRGLAYCLRRKPEPAWDEAIALYRQALELLTGPEDGGAQANALRGLAYCLRRKPEPAWDEAIALYRQALELLTRPEQRQTRANILHELAHCLHLKPAIDCEQAVACFREILDLRKAEEGPERGAALIDLANCLGCPGCKPGPAWDEAIALYRQALELLSRPDDVEARAQALRGLAYCLRRKPEPAWDEAIALYRQALELLTGSQHATVRASSLFDLAYCLHHKPKPAWDEAIALYYQALELVAEPEHATVRADALYDLAYCLHHRPEPAWDEAITLWQQALGLLVAPGQTVLETAASHPGYTIGLVTALDAKGLYEEADVWASRLDKHRLVDGEPALTNKQLSVQREAHLALRTNDLETTLSLTQQLLSAGKYPRATLLASIALFAKGKRDEAREAIATAGRSAVQKGWARAIATGYFNRYDSSQREHYISLLRL